MPQPWHQLASITILGMGACDANWHIMSFLVIRDVQSNFDYDESNFNIFGYSDRVTVQLQKGIVSPVVEVFGPIHRFRQLFV